MITAVFDTNIYFQAAVGKGGPAAECWQMVLNGAVRVYTSEHALAEVEDVLTRPKLRRQFPSLTNERISSLLKNYRAFSEISDQVTQFLKLDRDADDEEFLNLALTESVEFLVTRDNDLLDLRLDPEFLNSYPHLKIVNPFEFLQAVRESQ
jgi:putative PIN family toxin of toxin-antitoxin system